MAGRTQQYLRSEYIQPPPGPPTLDAKNSPLALLAQTCSAIGKELPSATKAPIHTKQFQSNVDAKKMATSSQPKASHLSPVMTSSTSPKQPSSPSSSENGRYSAPGRGLKREKSPTAQCTSPAKKSRSSPDASRNYSLSLHKTNNKLADKAERRRYSDVEPKRRHTISSSEQHQVSKQIKSESAMTRHRSPQSVSPQNGRSLAGFPAISTSTVESSRQLTNTISTSPHQQHLMSLYDPYCVGCQGQHVPGNPCFDSLKSPHMPFYPFGPASTYPFYAQMVMAAAARSGGNALESTPHVCNWVSVGTGSCGKRFGTADELFNHLRTHAVTTSNAATSGGSDYLMAGLDKLATNPYATYLSQQAAALAAVAPAAPNNFLSRSHSPLSRYNPYKGPMLGQLPGVPSLPIAAGVGPYCSPFTLYGQRLGATASAFSYQ